MALWGLARRKYGERSRHHRDLNDCPRLLLAPMSRSTSRPSIPRPCFLRLPMPPLVPPFSVYTHVRQTHQSCFAWTQKRHTEIPTEVACHPHHSSHERTSRPRPNPVVYTLPRLVRRPSVSSAAFLHLRLLTSSAQLFFRLPTLSSGFACSVESFVSLSPCDPLR